MNAIPEGEVARVVRENLRANINSTKHLMSELGWSKLKVKWGGVDYSRAVWIRPGYTIEGGHIFAEDGSRESLVDHLRGFEHSFLGADA